MSSKGRANKIGEDEKSVLCQIVTDKPLASTAQVQAEFTRRSGVTAHTATIRKGLPEAGVSRGQAELVSQPKATEQPARYGYQHWHRRQAREQRYASCLTDGQWALVADIFANPNGRGTPPRYPRRALVDACCYVVATGCSWRMLANGSPRWKNV